MNEERGGKSRDRRRLQESLVAVDVPVHSSIILQALHSLLDFALG